MTVVTLTADAARMAVVTLDARISHVTVYASGAKVVRTVTIPAPLPTRVRISALPVGVIDDTVRVEVGGPAIATNVRIGFDAPVTAAVPEDSDALRAARQRVMLADVGVERLTASLAAVRAAHVIEADESEQPPAAWGDVIAARRALVTLRAERELAVREQLATARAAADEAKRSLIAVTDRERRAGSATPPKQHELCKFAEIDLAATASGELVINLEYQVNAARWAPSYVARIDGDQARIELRAIVAQDTGEEWTAVPLVLSTAEPARFAVLPELAPQKIGRRQPDATKAGFRAAPTGAEALYADYERATRDAGRARIAEPAISSEVWDDGTSRSKEAFQTPPGGSVPLPQAMSAPMAAAPMMQEARSRGRAIDSVAEVGASMTKKSRSMFAGAGGAANATGGPPAEAPPALNPRLDYGSLRMAGPESPARGTLIAAAADPNAAAIAARAGAAQTRIANLTLPPGCAARWAHAYDYAYTTDGAIDVAADGAWHSIAVSAHTTTVALRHVTVPREQPDVFRVASFANPLAGPLLPGPIDIYDRGRFLITSDIDLAPSGSPVEVGLGVDASVKIARNTEFREEATGMLRGALRLHHSIDIEVSNMSPRTVDLEVRERIPVSREGDDDVEITLGKVEPAWENWTPAPDAPRDQRLRGGRRWKVKIGANEKRTLRAQYEVKIAGKNELVGGNRRES